MNRQAQGVCVVGPLSLSAATVCATPGRLGSLCGLLPRLCLGLLDGVGGDPLPPLGVGDGCALLPLSLGHGFLLLPHDLVAVEVQVGDEGADDADSREGRGDVCTSNIHRTGHRCGLQ